MSSAKEVCTLAGDVSVMSFIFAWYNVSDRIPHWETPCSNTIFLQICPCTHEY